MLHCVCKVLLPGPAAVTMAGEPINCNYTLRGGGKGRGVCIMIAGKPINCITPGGRMGGGPLHYDGREANQLCYTLGGPLYYDGREANQLYYTWGGNGGAFALCWQGSQSIALHQDRGGGCVSPGGGRCVWFCRFIKAHGACFPPFTAARVAAAVWQSSAFSPTVLCSLPRGCLS